MTKTREERLKRIAERHSYRVGKATKECERRFKAADASEEATGIPFGQPILVGHHSERRHRAALKKLETNFRKAIEASKEAEEANRLAHGAALALEGRNNHGALGILSRDSDALELLREKLAQEEQERDRIKAENKAMRGIVSKGPDDLEAVEKTAKATGWSMEQAAKFVGFIWRMYPGAKTNAVGHFDYETKNRSANIRRIKARIAELEALDNAPDFLIEADGMTARSDKEARTIVLEFPGKPPEYVRLAIKGRGFRWVPSLGVWSKKRTAWAEQDAASIAKRHFGWNPA